MADSGVWDDLILTLNSTFKLEQGFGAKPAMSRADVALAIPMGRGDALGIALALSIACASTLEAPIVEDMAHPRLMDYLRYDRMIGPTLKKHTKQRTRVLVRHAYVDLVRGRERRLDLGARTAKMRREAYVRAYRASVAWMQNLADEAGLDALYQLESAA